MRFLEIPLPDSRPRAPETDGLQALRPVLKRNALRTEPIGNHLVYNKGDPRQAPAFNGMGQDL